MTSTRVRIASVLQAVVLQAVLGLPSGTGDAADCFINGTAEQRITETTTNQGASRPRSLAVGDLDGDNHLDVVTASEGPFGYQVILNDQNGSLSPPGTVVDLNPVASGLLSIQIAVGQLNEDVDDFLDFAIADNVGNRVIVGFNDGNANFETFQLLTGARTPFYVTARDLDGDNKIDLLAAESRGVVPFFGDGSGNFESARRIRTGSDAGGVAVVDIDGDSDMDIVVANGGSPQAQGLSVVRRNEDGTYADPENYPTPGTASFVAAANLNLDDKPDVVTVHNNQTVSVRFNNGDGTLGAPVDISTGESAIHCLIEDVNGDGPLDIVTVNQATGTIAVLINDGEGLFPNPPTILALGDTTCDPPACRSGNNCQPCQSRYIATGDFDNDNNPDVVSANTFGQSITLLLNKCEAGCGVPVGSQQDCNNNGTRDGCEIDDGSVPDCNTNGTPDGCDLASGMPDCDGNGIPDGCDITSGTPDCNRNGVPDGCDLEGGTDTDANANGVPDGCETGSTLVSYRADVSECDFGDGTIVPCGTVGKTAGGSAPWQIEVSPCVESVDVTVDVKIDSRIEPCFSVPELCDKTENFRMGDVFGCSDSTDNDQDGLTDLEDPDCFGVKAWSFTVLADPCFRVSADGLTTDGTAAALIQNGGLRGPASFARTQVTEAEVEGGPQRVASAVIVALTDPVILPQIATSTVLRFRGTMDNPLAGQGAGLPCGLNFSEEGEAGGDFSTIVTIGDASLLPNLIHTTLAFVSDGTPPEECKEPPDGAFVRGDCDGDGNACTGVADALRLLSWSFLGGAAPACLWACNADGNSELEGITDAVFGLTFCFLGGPSPLAPYPDCGPAAPGDAEIGCETPPAPCAGG